MRYLKNHLFGIWEITAQCDEWFSALYKYSYLLTSYLLTFLKCTDKWRNSKNREGEQLKKMMMTINTKTAYTVRWRWYSSHRDQSHFELRMYMFQHDPVSTFWSSTEVFCLDQHKPQNSLQPAAHVTFCVTHFLCFDLLLCNLLLCFFSMLCVCHISIKVYLFTFRHNHHPLINSLNNCSGVINIKKFGAILKPRTNVMGVDITQEYSYL